MLKLHELNGLGGFAGFDTATRRFVAYVRCQTCRAHYQEDFKKQLPSDILVKKIMVSSGWVNRGNRWKCGACQKKKDGAMRNGAVSANNVTAVAARPPETAAVKSETPTAQPNLKQMRQIMEFLETNFDESKGLWLGGLSDRMAGDKLNVPAAMVALVREEAYGPLRMPVEYEKLRDDVSDLRKMLDDVEQRLRAEMSRFRK